MLQQVSSKLESRLQALLRFLFDVTSMTNALLEFEVSKLLLFELPSRMASSIDLLRDLLD